MNYSFASRMDNLTASTIREIFKFASDPKVISLAAGSPSSLAFPHEQIQEITTKIFSQSPTLALQYNITEGYAPLREFCLQTMKNENSVNETDDLLITTGAQQAIELFTKALINKGDTILCENPSFLGSINSFKSYEANLVSVNTDNDGVNLVDLELKLSQNPNTKFIYLIPNFSNPSGITTSLLKRKKVYEIACKYNVLILEDNPYGALRFNDLHIPNIKSFDTDGRVAYVGSFSKILSPGIRVGFLLANKSILEKCVICKQCSDVHTPMISQMICHEFVSNYDLNAHIQKLCDIYSKKASLMLSEIDKKFDKRISHTSPNGGLFIWCTLPDHVNMLTFCKKAIEEKVAIVPGNAFLVDENLPCQSFRLNYSTPTDEQIINAIDILSKIDLDALS